MKNGILVINKPEGISSARVVSQVKRKLKAKKVGHTGTLDPFATGVLLCAVNKGTRISKFFLGGDKRYTAKICLGVETDTYDRTGQTVEKADSGAIESISASDIHSAVSDFVGSQEQIPPAYSALKQDGQPLYKLARQGKMIQKPPRKIQVYEINVLNIEKPYIDIDIACSSGTYIRSIAYDIGKKLGCGAHLAELCRTCSGSFSIDQALNMKMLDQLDETQLENKMVPLAACLSFLPKAIVADENMAKIRHGQTLKTIDVSFENKPKAGLSDLSIRVVDQKGELLAIVTPSENGQTYNYSCVFLS